MGCQGGFSGKMWTSLLGIFPRHWEDRAEVAGPCAGSWRLRGTGGHCSSPSARRVQAAPSSTSSGTWEPGVPAKNFTGVWQLLLEGRPGQMEIRECQQLFGRGWAVKRVLLERPA